MTTSLSLDERGILLNCPHCGKRNRLGYARLGQTGRCGSCGEALPAGPHEPVEIGDAAEFRALTTQSALPVLVDFWAQWCPPCRMMAPELVKVAARGAGRWIIAKLNTEQVRGVDQALGVQALPTLIVFYGGREIARDSGARPADALVQFLENAVRS